MSIDFANLWSVLEGRFQLGQHSVHGSSHCRRVEENGIELAEISGGDLVVVKLFAVFHDVERESDGSDPEHGIRASELARKLHGNLFDVDDTRLEKLVYACEHHNRGFTIQRLAAVGMPIDRTCLA